MTWGPLVLVGPVLGVMLVIVGMNVHNRFTARSVANAPRTRPSVGWFADPTGCHSARFWDGVAWTGRVADDGTEALDPVDDARMAGDLPDPEIAQAVWQDGRELVMHIGAELPDRCVKTNRPAHGRRVSVVVGWTDPGNGVSFSVWSFAFREYVRVKVGLSRRALWRIRFARSGSYLLAAAGSICAAAAFVIPKDWRPVVGAAWVLWAAAFVCHYLGAQILTASLIRGDYVWLGGVSPAYLVGLPHWPYGYDWHPRS